MGRMNGGAGDKAGASVSIIRDKIISYRMTTAGYLIKQLKKQFWAGKRLNLLIIRPWPER